MNAQSLLPLPPSYSLSIGLKRAILLAVLQSGFPVYLEFTLSYRYCLTDPALWGSLHDGEKGLLSIISSSDSVIMLV
jgi:hypothetical protein